jgi:hypothetical protein
LKFSPSDPSKLRSPSRYRRIARLTLPPKLKTTTRETKTKVGSA